MQVSYMYLDSSAHRLHHCSACVAKTKWHLALSWANAQRVLYSSLLKCCIKAVSAWRYLKSLSNKAIAVMCLAHLDEIRLDGAKLCHFLNHCGRTAQKVHWPQWVTFDLEVTFNMTKSWGILRCLYHPNLVAIRQGAKLCQFLMHYGQTAQKVH